MKDFRVEAIAQTEFEEAAGWYETQREGLGFELIAEVDRVLVRIAHQETFQTVETSDERRVIMIRRGSSDPSRWRSRL